MASPRDITPEWAEAIKHWQADLLRPVDGIGKDLHNLFVNDPTPVNVRSVSVPAPPEGVPPPAPPALPWIQPDRNQRRRREPVPLQFVPPKPDKAFGKALPLDPDQISDALGEQFLVVEARELTDLDVWFIVAIRDSYYDIIMYEHMGEWKCSSITKRKDDGKL